ncbi:MAG: hypothetical protein IJU47_02580 [Verrucomicrobia bacterium]|nr:hypothetical protein [Verrucomicrobiota bacterium]
MKENKLNKNSVIKDYLTTATDAQLADQMDDNELKLLEQQIKERKF